MSISSERKAKGLCKTCGKPLDRKGIECSICNKRQNEYQRSYVIKHAINNICSRCKNKLDREGWLCSNCLEKHKLNSNEKYNELKSKGLCVRCSKPSFGYAYCEKCRAIRNARAREVYTNE